MENKEKEAEFIKSLISDLVKIAYRSHSLLMVAQIPASHSKEANELMEVCESIYKEFVVDEKDVNKN